MKLLHQSNDIIADRYKILEQLGEGGTGITYKAVDLTQQHVVALKALSFRRTTDWKTIEMFEREAQTLAQLNHPAIPHYLDYFQVETEGDRCFYIVQQLAPGRSLAELVGQKWHPDESQVKNLAVQLLQVLCYLQSLLPPVIHRDIKPQNIICDEKGHICLVDFGAVQDTYHQTVTGGSTVVGTYGYMAPEQYRGQAVLSTDLYGLGTTLLFLLTHCPPSELPQRQFRFNFRSSIRVSKSFADWLACLVEPAVEDRFTTASDALAALQGKQPIPVASPFVNKPKDSPVRILRDSERIVINIPPVGLRTKHAQWLSLFTMIWDGLLALLVWLLVDLSLFLQPASLIPVIGYACIGLWLFSKWIYITCSRTQVEINDLHIHLQKWVLGSRYFKLSQSSTSITGASLHHINLPSQQHPFTFCAIHRGRKVHHFGGFLSPAENAWIMSELKTFLRQRSPGASQLCSE